MTDNHFLVIRLSHLGDIVLTTGVLDYWHRKRGWKFHFVTTQSMLPLFLEHPAVVDVVSVTSEYKSFGAWLRFCFFLRKRYGHIPLIDLHGSLRSRILKTLWPSKVYRYPKFRLSRRLYQYFGHKSSGEQLELTNIPQRYSLACEMIAPPPLELLPRVFLREEERHWAKEVLAPVKDRSIVALHPYSVHEAKQWPWQKWADLAKKLRQKGKAIIIIGQEDISPEDAEKSSDTSFADLDLTNRTNVAQTAAVLEQADILVSGDSGPMHLGTAVDTPVVGLFGPTCRQWGFFPSGPKDTVISLNNSCSPCSLHGQKHCSDAFSCMRNINVTTVLDVIANRLA